MRTRRTTWSSQETSGGDQWYDINTTIQTANVASETTGVWSPDGVTYNLYGSPDESYGPLNFLYSTATVSTAPMITQQPQNATIAVNGTATFTVGASGGNLTYQWWSEAPAGTSFTQISGATASSYTTPAEGLAASGTQYECVVTNNLGSATSNAVTLTVQTSTATAYVSSQTLGTLRNNFSGWVGMSVTVGNTPLTVTALGRMEVAGNTGNHTVQIVNASGQVLSGGSATVSTAAGSAGSFLYANLTSPVTLNANTTYYIVSQETSGGDQWYDINTTIQTANVASETTGVWSPDGVTYNLYGSPDESYGPLNFLYSTATVSTAPMITQQPQNATIAVNGTATFTVGASGGNLTYQWWSEAPAGTSFTQISGATASSYTTPAEGLAASGTQYECVVTNNLGSATSNAVTLTVQTSTATAYVSSQTLGTLRNNFSGWVGMSVTVGNTPLTVTALGRMEVAGNTGNHTVQIVNASGQVLSGGSATVSTAAGSAGSFLYANLTSPVTLNANTTYYIVSQETSGGDQWYDINTTIQTANVASETTGVWSPDGVTYNLYGSSDESYGPLNFLYTSKPATSAALITEVTLGTGRNNFSGWVGGSITTASGGMQVTELGRYVVAGNTETHIVKLVNASTGQDVTGGSVTVNLAGGQAGTFAYSQLSSPVTLSPNTAYYLVSQEVQGGDQWYDFNTTIQTTGVASETTSVWSPDGVTYNLIGPSNQMYVPLNLIYALQ